MYSSGASHGLHVLISRQLAVRHAEKYEGEIERRFDVTRIQCHRFNEGVDGFGVSPKPEIAPTARYLIISIQPMAGLEGADGAVEYRCRLLALAGNEVGLAEHC